MTRRIRRQKEELSMMPMEHTSTGTRRKTLSRDVAEALRRKIASGDYPVGVKLPAERLLAEEFGVNRHAVREALKRLEALGLVRIKHGVGIFVERLQLSVAVESFNTLLLYESDAVNRYLLDNVFEYRRHLGAMLVRLAAQRRTPRELGAICRLIDDLCCFAGDIEREERIAFDLFACIAKATHNQVYELVYNTVGAIFLELRRTFDVPIMGMQGGEAALMRLRQAFENADPDTAEAVILQYLSAVEDGVEPICASPSPTCGKQVAMRPE